MEDKDINKKIIYYILKVWGGTVCDLHVLPYRLLRFDAGRIRKLLKDKPSRYALRSFGIAVSDLWLPAAVLVGGLTTSAPILKTAGYMAGAFYVNAMMVARRLEKKNLYIAMPRLAAYLDRLFQKPAKNDLPMKSGPA